jgi:hypothetical protein
MSTATNTQRLTPAQRIAEATQEAASLLELDDLKTLTAALVVSALEGARRNAGFAQHVRSTYEQMLPPKKPARAPAAKRQASKRADDVELVPIKDMRGHEVIPGAAPDPYFLLELYGARQLPPALGRYSLRDLQLAAEAVQQHMPGTRPKSKARRDSLIEYIVAHLVGQE